MGVLMVQGPPLDLGAPCSSFRSYRQTGPASNAPRVSLVSPAVINFPLWPTLQHLFERDSSFESRQGGAETEVQPVPEAEMQTSRSMDIESIRILEVPFITVRRAVEKQHDGVLAENLSMDLDVVRKIASLDRGGSLVAQDLFNG